MVFSSLIIFLSLFNLIWNTVDDRVEFYDNDNNYRAITSKYDLKNIVKFQKSINFV